MSRMLPSDNWNSDRQPAGTHDGDIILLSGQTLIGRTGSCQIVIHEVTASRKHAVITRSGNGITIADLGSRNGTFVNGNRVEQTNLTVGDVILCGDSAFRIENNPSRLVPHFPFDDASTNDVDLDEPRFITETVSLSPAEQNVLDMLLRGRTEKEVAEELHRSPHTIHNHIREIYKQFDVNSRPELMARCMWPRSRDDVDGE